MQLIVSHNKHTKQRRYYVFTELSTNDIDW